MVGGARSHGRAARGRGGDHLDRAGQIGDEGANHHTGFDDLRLYRNLAFDLSARGL